MDEDLYGNTLFISASNHHVETIGKHMPAENEHSKADERV